MANTQWNSADKTAGITLTGSNLIATQTGGINNAIRAVDRQVTGKFYWECTYNTAGSASDGVGVANGTLSISGAVSSSAGQCNVNRNGVIQVDATNTGSTLGAWASGAVICIAFDCSTTLIWFRLGAAGLWNGSASANPTTGSGGIATKLGLGIPAYPLALLNATSDQITANFGDTAFTGAVPSGYTSGFTAGTSVPTNAIASQALAEHWLTTNPDARITQVVAEHWASVTSDNLQAVVTQVLIEHWASVASVSPASGGPQVTMIH